MEPWLENFARAIFARSSDTAHDLKTPLNVAVLNLELLRMRLRKLAGGEDDAKVLGYTASIETELRRLARIFDTFFVLSTPPKGEEAPAPVDLVPLLAEHELAVDGPIHVLGHEPRIRQALSLFFEGAAKVLANREASFQRDERFHVLISGDPSGEDFEVTKIFKFYYTDASGNADLSLAAARLIAETYGGELNATLERDKVVLRLSVPWERNEESPDR